jgi:dipeptidyl-peptidase-4
VYRDRNLWITNTGGGNEVAITSDGSEEDRIKYATASWVYGEELGQNTAMWWSPSGQKLAFYRFDESQVQDFYLQMEQTEIQSSLDIEAYPKAGTTNPSVSLFVYDLAAGTTVEIDARDGQPLTDDVVGHYVYGVQWSPNGDEITFRRTNRRQNVMEYTACSPDTGACRVIVHEEWPTGWVQNSPTIRFLADDQSFVWLSERTGFRNFYLYDFGGQLLATLTDHDFEVGNIVRVDEDAGVMYYMARDGENHMKMQLHRVGLDGTGDVRLTDPAFNHSVDIAPDGRHFIDVAQTHDTAPFTNLLDSDGEIVAELAESDMSRFEQLDLEPVEMYTFMAADGVTELRAMLHKPSNFDPTRAYPMLVSVYGGPSSAGARESFTLPSTMTEYGFLYLTINGRNAGGRGKRILDSIYESLGIVEIDDMAAAVRALWDRPYLDREAVGIYGTSYGGYASAMAILRHPDAFQAASASSAVTDWRHYDTIYTERYMWTPQGNTAGYDAGSAMNYAENLEGALMIYYGTADNNVHPSNSMQLIAALQAAGKTFEVQVGPDRGHSGINQARMMEFFIEHLVLRRD